MALTLPLKFQQSIQSKDTNLIPCVLIGSPNKIIGISTNEIILDNEEYLPLLLNIPSLKESIDLEKRKYKISNLILDISNLEYNGQRFSDIVGKNSLINQVCQIFWIAPNITIEAGNFSIEDDAFLVFSGIIRRYNHTDERVKLTLEDSSQSVLNQDLPLPKEENYLEPTNVPDKFANKPIPPS